MAIVAGKERTVIVLDSPGLRDGQPPKKARPERGWSILSQADNVKEVVISNGLSTCISLALIELGPSPDPQRPGPLVSTNAQLVLLIRRGGLMLVAE